MRHRGFFIELKREKLFLSYLFFHYLYWLPHKSYKASPLLKSMPSSKLHTRYHMLLTQHRNQRQQFLLVFTENLAVDETLSQILSHHNLPQWQVISLLDRWRGGGPGELRSWVCRADSKEGFGSLWMTHPRSSGTSLHDPPTSQSCPNKGDKKQKQVWMAAPPGWVRQRGCSGVSAHLAVGSQAGCEGPWAPLPKTRSVCESVCESVCVCESV